MTEDVWAVMAVRLLRAEGFETSDLDGPYIALCDRHRLEVTQDRLSLARDVGEALDRFGDDVDDADLVDHLEAVGWKVVAFLNNPVPDPSRL